MQYVMAKDFHVSPKELRDLDEFTVSGLLELKRLAERRAEWDSKTAAFYRGQ